MTTGEQWQKVQCLFHAALEREPGDRQAFLDEACDGNEALRRKVVRLLSAHEQENHFIDSPAYVAAAGMLIHHHEFKSGETLGHYKIRYVLGEGGMGKVYLAEDTKLKRNVALKVLPDPNGGSEEGRRRLLREAQAAAALDHPNICAIYEVDEARDHSYIAMQYVEGETLEARMAKGKLSLDDALNVASQVAGALAKAHAHNIVHRDIKPSNIMLASCGQVKVLDFGLAKTAAAALIESNAAETKEILTTPGMILGTVPYMSPEQLRGETVDMRSDIFSFGVVLYEMLSGRSAFGRNTDAETIGAILHEQPPELSSIDPNMPHVLADVVGKCLAKNVKQRYQTVQQVEHDLNAARTAEFAAVRIPAAPTRETEIDRASPRETAGTDMGRARQTSNLEYLVSKVRHHRQTAILAAVAVLLAAAALSYYFYFAKGGETIDSIAVMPFVNVSNDPNAEYLSDGISDSLINSLSQLPNIKKVISLSSVLRYKGKEIDPQAVGRELNVRAVLTGRLTQRGDELLISTELVDVKDSKRLWGGQYNRKLADVLPLQGEISREIVERLRLRLTGEEKQRLAKRSTDDPEAYRLYLLGRFYRRNRLDFQKARDYLEQAIQKDPSFASAYAQLAYVYHNLAFSPSQHEEASQKAQWAARKALELDDTIGDAHAVLGLLNKDLKELERALELDPNSPDTQSFYAKMLWSKRLDEAIPHMRRAQELDPLSPVMYVDLGKMLNSAHRFDEAMQQYRKALELNPNFRAAHRNLALCYAVQGRYEEAIAEADRTRSPENPEGGFELRGFIYGLWGKRAEALKMLDDLNELSKQKDVHPGEFALIYTGLGDKDKAFEFLQRKHPMPLLPPLRVDPVWDNLRSDPRFEEILRLRESRSE